MKGLVAAGGFAGDLEESMNGLDASAPPDGLDERGESRNGLDPPVDVVVAVADGLEELGKSRNGLDGAAVVE